LNKIFFLSIQCLWREKPQNILIKIYPSLLGKLKGTVSWDFQPLVFLLILSTLRPWLWGWNVFEKKFVSEKLFDYKVVQSIIGLNRKFFRSSPILLGIFFRSIPILLRKNIFKLSNTTPKIFRSCPILLQFLDYSKNSWLLRKIFNILIKFFLKCNFEAKKYMNNLIWPG